MDKVDAVMYLKASKFIVLLILKAMNKKTAFTLVQKVTN